MKLPEDRLDYLLTIKNTDTESSNSDESVSLSEGDMYGFLPANTGLVNSSNIGCFFDNFSTPSQHFSESPNVTPSKSSTHSVGKLDVGLRSDYVGSRNHIVSRSEIKKEKNKESARKSRHKKQIKMAVLEESSRLLREENLYLRGKLDMKVDIEGSIKKSIDNLVLSFRNK
ncbi:hypothetical protein NADFUDRAFT_40011 [Nadsonia fulvescens var. elongata DSM 6958]|uniref:BZIP domain-containing protein n=1 Tax=Nadsonia fulvescens var. elongata DSM 6958 TaxID=857566 RepID=A0A1E3PT92_9ASCO|nr:hypothetical protein NADFUDRAFT_40011 [Nadsonia fulvescens var. elongata DSM 6958]